MTFPMRVCRALGATALAAGSMAATIAAAPVGDSGYERYAKPTTIARIGRGRTISWNCIGQGTPRIILTAGAGDWSAVWRKVQGAVGATTRACAWDRAGFGLSGPSAEVQDVRHTEADLEGALAAAGIHGPYVLVSHSLGGYEALLFADRRLREVAGFVLVDPAFPDQFRLMAKHYPRVARLQTAVTSQNIQETRDCLTGLHNHTIKPTDTGWSNCMSDDPEYPQALRRRLSDLTRDPRRLKTQLSFTESESIDAQQVINPVRNYGDRPLIVLTATDTPDLPRSLAPPAVADEMKEMQAHGWLDGHDRLAALSSRGRNIQVKGSTHYIQLLRPQAVIDATLTVVREARQAY